MKLILEKIPYRISESIHSVNWHWSEIACPYHYHSEVELVWIKKSRGRFTIGDYQGEFEKGDMYLIGSNIPHVFYNNKDHIPRSDSANLVVIQFSELFLGQQA